jgi:phosphoenolpyruvate synthase/pyruvate phosphate dikinase
VCGCEAEYAGAKAAQLSLLCALGGLNVPPGLVVPFAAYVQHLGRVRDAGALRSMLSAARFRADANERARQLAALRGAIEAAPVDGPLLAQVRAELRRLGRRERFIFRSSTNAEDLAGFNGAGLYESVVVPGDASDEVLADALRRVWASVWLQRGYEEREWFRVDHEAVAMAVLVQPFVADVVANGVAVTRNPYDEARPGVFINTQVSGGSVTGAGGNELPEQFLVYTWAEDLEPELLSRSSLTRGAPILNEAEVMALTAQLVRIDANLTPRYPGLANAMDVEFLLTRDRRFVFVQARPINVLYTEGQRWGVY